MAKKYKIEFGLTSEGERKITLFKKEGRFPSYWAHIKGVYERNPNESRDNMLERLMKILADKISNDAKNQSFAENVPMYFDVNGDRTY